MLVDSLPAEPPMMPSWRDSVTDERTFSIGGVNKWMGKIGL